MSSHGQPSRSALAAALAGWAALVSCAAPARPPEMAKAAEVAASPAAVEAAAWAPQAHARAGQLQQRAEAAYAEGDGASAALLAEQALATHERAWALTRLARAERRRLAAEAELAEQRQALEALRVEQQRLSAEAAGLELRARAAGGSLPAVARRGAGGERQKAAAALATQARLLCVAARLLGEGRRVEPLVARLDALERELAVSSAAAPLEAATTLRAECLDVISDARRSSMAPAARAPGATSPPAGPRAPVPADVVLDELGAIGAAPSRDERGVAVALRDVLGEDGALTAAARQELASIAKVVDAHRDFPLLIVGHGTGSALERQLAAVEAELARAATAPVAVQAVGERLPLLPPGSAAARERNARIELVFVAPGF